MDRNCWTFIAIMASALILAGKVTIAQTAADEDLVTLANKKFTAFSSDEEKKAFETFFQNTQDGKKADLTPNLETVTDSRDRKILADPVYADLWEKDRILKAEWLVWLCTDPKASAKITSKGIEIAGARIQGKVDLAWVKIQFPLRTFRCAFTEDLILDRASLRSLQLQATRIKGLHGDGLTVEREILFEDGFQAEGEVWLQDANISGSLRCDGGQFINPHANALNLNSAKVGTTLVLGQGFKAEGAVVLSSLTIGAILDCSGGKFKNPQALALDLVGAKTGSVYLGNGFRAEGQVRLQDAVIAGSVECDGGQFSNPGGIALNLDKSKSGAVLLRDYRSFHFIAEGEVTLQYAAIDGIVTCEGGQFINPKAFALNFMGAKTGSVYLGNGFIAKGQVELQNATIDGVLDCRGGRFINRDGYAVILANTKTGPIYMGSQFQAEGEVNLFNATVSGILDCDGGRFCNPGGIALNLEKSKSGAIYLRKGFNAEGGVRLYNAVSGNVECDGGQFKNRHRIALDLELAQVGAVLLRNQRNFPFKAEGQVRLRHATLNGDLEFTGGNIENTDKDGFAIFAKEVKIDGGVVMDGGFKVNGGVDFQDSRIEHGLVLKGVNWQENASLDLRSAKVKTLLNQEKSWPGQDKLFLHGFVFDEFDIDARPGVKTQNAWIQRQSRENFLTQPYEQTAEVLRKMGMPDEAVKILIEKNLEAGSLSISSNLRQIRTYLERIGKAYPWQQLRSFEYSAKLLWVLLKVLSSICWYYIFGLLIGYGYYSWGALIPSIIIIVFGWRWLERGHDAGFVIPAKDNAWRDYAKYQYLPKPYPKFNAFIYSLEKFVPLVKLEMGDYWAPDPNREDGRRLRIYLWCHIIAGWVFTTLWVGGLTGLIKT